MSTTSSLPTTPKNSSSAANTPKSNNTNTKACYHYNPYNNFARVYTNSVSPSVSGTTTPRHNKNNGSKTHSRSVSTESHDHHNNSMSMMMMNNNNMNNNVEEEYCYINEHHDDTCTPPACRNETEQHFNSAATKKTSGDDVNERSSSSDDETFQQGKIGSLDEDNNNTSASVSIIDKPKPRSSTVTTTIETEEPQQQMRAAVRTMQHLLQNVPYLFLDSVAESTVLCRDHSHKVGQNISAWSAAKTPKELEEEFPERYQGQVIRDIFVAQLPFDLPLDAIQLVADLLIEGDRIHVLHAAPHIKMHKSYDGCSFVKMFECDAIRFINAMHKRVLFDVDGIWVATSLPELQELTDYCAWFQEQKNDQRKEILKMPTPFSAMTAEFALRGTRKSGSFVDNRVDAPVHHQQNNHNNNNHHHYQHQQQYRGYYNNNNSYNNNNNGYYYNNNNQAPVVADQNPHQRAVSPYYNNNNNQNHQGTYQAGASYYQTPAHYQYRAPHQQQQYNYGY